MYQFVGNLLSARTADEKCEACGTRIRFLKGEFWLQKTVLKWGMTLPFCPMCDGPVEGSLDYSAIFQPKAKSIPNSSPRHRTRLFSNR
jgi:hypothetical protein